MLCFGGFPIADGVLVCVPVDGVHLELSPSEFLLEILLKELGATNVKCSSVMVAGDGCVVQDEVASCALNHGGSVPMVSWRALLELASEFVSADIESSIQRELSSGCVVVLMTSDPCDGDVRKKSQMSLNCL